MNRIFSAVLLAAAATWAIRRWLNGEASRRGMPYPQLETWENEGGALAPYQAALDTSQMQR